MLIRFKGSRGVGCSFLSDGTEVVMEPGDVADVSSDVAIGLCEQDEFERVEEKPVKKAVKKAAKTRATNEETN